MHATEISAFECRFDTQRRIVEEKTRITVASERKIVANMHKKHLLIRADMQNQLTVLFTHHLALLTIKTARLIEPRPLLLKISLARMRHCNRTPCLV